MPGNLHSYDIGYVIRRIEWYLLWYLLTVKAYNIKIMCEKDTNTMFDIKTV